MKVVEYYFKFCNLPLTEDTKRKIIHYSDLIYEENKKYNLTGLKDRHEILIKLVLDSLLFFRINIYKNIKNLCDIGTGAGIPGIPISICLGNKEVALIESNQKKAKFLERVANELMLHNIKVVNKRAEEIGRDINYREKFDCCVVRNLGKINFTCELSSPFLMKGGHLIIFTKQEYSLDKLDIEEKLRLSYSAEKKFYIRYKGKYDIKEEEFDCDYIRTIMFFKKVDVLDIKYPRRIASIKRSL